MSQQLVRDTYQANGLIKSLGHPHSAIASSQTSLQKMPASSPQFLYQSTNSANNRHQNQQQMQFHQQQQQFVPPSKPIKNDSIMNSLNSLLVPQQQQQSQVNGVAYSVMPALHQNHHQPPPSINGISNNNNSSLIQPMIMPTPIMSTNKSDTQLDHQLTQQQVSQSNPNLNSQAPVVYQMQQQQQQQQQQNPSNGQQQQQYVTQPMQQQHGASHNNIYDNNQQQNVPITTVMIPASAAAQIQSASMQIQQAALQASGTNPQLQQTPQIFVFMIPYMVNNFPQQQLQQPQQLPPTLPTTPEQGSLNSTLVRPSHQSSSNSSIIRQQQQQQHQQATNQFNQHHHQTSSSASHSRAVSSLSISTAATTTASKLVEQEKFYIKANFNHQATRNRQELSFQKGDILHVLDTLQNNKDYGIQYWLATRVKPNGEDAEKGLIPNKSRAEAIAMEQRTMNVGEANGASDGNGGGVLSASVGRVNFLKRRAAQRSKSLCKDNWDNVIFEIGNYKLPTYERVIFKHPGFCRPVVIFGPLSDIAREKLLRDYPEKYSYPTGLNQTAPDHPKVIRLKGVVDVIDQGKHALLDITTPAVEKLNFVNLAPIVIFMKTDSKSIIKEFRARAAKSLDPNACDEDTLRRDGKSSRKLLEQSMKLEKQWSHVFTATLDLSTMGSEMWYRKLRETIENQQSANVWMSDKKSDKKLANSSTGNSNNTMSNAGQNVANNNRAAANERMSLSMTTSNSNGTLQQQQQQQSSTSCLPADSSSMLNERFSDCLNISSTKSTNDLKPMLPTSSEMTYGNRSQMRNAYAHSLAQKLARASSEPKLNGLLSDNDVVDDDENDDDDEDDDDDDDDDDEIIKKPFPSEFENSSSISSSNGCASYGQCSLTNGAISANATSSNSIYQVHQYQMQQQQQLQQPIIKPPAPPPPPSPIPVFDNSVMNGNSSNNIAHLAARAALQANQLQQPPQQECIYSSTRNPLINNSSFVNSNTNINNYNRDYHPLPSMPPSNNDNGFDTDSSSQHHHQQQQQQRHSHNNTNGQINNQQHHQQLQNMSQHQQNINNSSNLQHPMQANLKNNNIIDLSRNHEARGSAFQVYSDMNQNNYHYYNLNKI